MQTASGLHLCCSQVCIFLPLPVLQKAVFRTLKDRLLHCRWRPLRGVSAVLFVREAYSINHYMPPFAQKQAINGMLMYNWNSLVFSISPLFADIFPNDTLPCFPLPLLSFCFPVEVVGIRPEHRCRCSRQAFNPKSVIRLNPYFVLPSVWFFLLLLKDVAGYIEIKRETRWRRQCGRMVKSR